MPKAVQSSARTTLKDIEDEIRRKWRHATELTHPQTIYLARNAGLVNLRFFAVISNKSTLGAYSERIARDPEKFYNKCAVYLLEKVGKYVSQVGYAEEPPDVVFEARNHDYGALRRYVMKIKENPMHREANHLSIFDPSLIVSHSKGEEPLLKYADIASYSVYQCANKSKANYFIPEPRYLLELSKRFGADESGKVLNTGIKCIHKLSDLQLDPDIESVLTGLRADPPPPGRA